ncbi:hypothetical protein ABK040_004465 [Willaertia magna]
MISNTTDNKFELAKELFYSKLITGAYLRMEEDYVSALDYFNQAIDLEPNNYEGYLEKSICMSLFNKPIDSIRILYEGLFRCNFSYCFSNEEREVEKQYFFNIFKGLIEEANERYEESLLLYKKAAELVPNGFYALFSLGFSLGSLSLDSGPIDATLKVKYIKESKQYFLDALEILQKSSHHSKYHKFYISILYTNIGWVERESNELSNESLRYYTLAANLNQKHIRAFCSRASLYSKQNLYSEAIADISTCIQIRENHVNHWIGIDTKLQQCIQQRLQKRQRSNNNTEEDDEEYIKILKLLDYLDSTESESLLNKIKEESEYTRKSKGLSLSQMRAYEKRLSDLYEERGILYLENNQIFESMKDFTIARVIYPLGSYAYMISCYTLINILGSVTRGMKILTKYETLISDEEYLRDNYPNLSRTDFIDMSTLYKYRADWHNNVATISTGDMYQDNLKKASSDEKMGKMLMNIGRIF